MVIYFCPLSEKRLSFSHSTGGVLSTAACSHSLSICLEVLASSIIGMVRGKQTLLSCSKLQSIRFEAGCSNCCGGKLSALCIKGSRVTQEFDMPRYGAPSRKATIATAWIKTKVRAHQMSVRSYQVQLVASRQGKALHAWAKRVMIMYHSLV